MIYKKALVTGGAGFIGSHVVGKLVRLGIKTVALDDFSMGRRENVPYEEVEIVEGDIRDQQLVEDCLKGVDVVFHQAARVSIRSSVHAFCEDSDVNIQGTLSVLKAIIKSGVKKLVYASSMAVYGDSQYLPINEDHLTEPKSPYGLSKLAAEKYCSMMGEICGFDVVILRYFNTFGPGQTLTPYVGVMTIFINRILAGKRPIIFGSGEQIRDFVYVGDVAEANILAMQTDVRNGVFNIGSGVGTSVNDLFGLLVDRMKVKIEPRHELEQRGEPSDSIADTSRSKQVLNFSPQATLAQKIPEVIEWNKCRDVIMA